MSAFPTQRCCALCFSFCVLLLGCNDVRRASDVDVGGEKSTQGKTSYSLSAKQMGIVQWIGPELREPEKQKFVQIEVVKVFNPDKQPIIFEVFFQAENHEKVFLGAFSLFPPDNPGKFIVATKGRLRSHGAIALSMVLPKGIESTNSINVEVRNFTFREH